MVSERHPVLTDSNRRKIFTFQARHSRKWEFWPTQWNSKDSKGKWRSRKKFKIYTQKDSFLLNEKNQWLIRDEISIKRWINNYSRKIFVNQIDIFPIEIDNPSIFSFCNCYHSGLKCLLFSMAISLTFFKMAESY
jgi:hypothetical protein